MRPVVLIVSGMLMMMTGPASAPANTLDSADRTATRRPRSRLRRTARLVDDRVTHGAQEK